MTQTSTLLEVEALNKIFYSSNKGIFSLTKSQTHAVKDISFTLEKGTTLGIIGQSGSGKSTLSRILIGLEEPTSGTITYKGKDIRQLSRKVLAKEIQMVFQDSYGTVDPRMSIYRILSEPHRIHKIYQSSQALKNAIFEVLDQVEIPRSFIHKFPHELSGGQLQRINIARALLMNPEVIIFDEPTSSLDVSIQAQILNLLKKMQKEQALTYIFVTHEMGIVNFISDDLLVMHKGEIVERGKTWDVITNPKHEYTQKLMDAVPIADPKYRKFKRSKFKKEKSYV